MKYICFMALTILVTNLSCTQSGIKYPKEYPVQAEYIKAHVDFLADDMLEGREAGTRGEILASLYLSSELRKYGVLPFGNHGNYFQYFNLEKIKFDKKSHLVLFDHQGDTLALYKEGEDFIGSTRYYEDFNLSTGLVFAGYGIQAAEYNYDDYESLEVDGQIVLLLSGEPESEDSTYFAGSDRTPYSATRHKLSMAAEQGALGVILLSGSEKIYGWESLRNYVQRGGVKLPGQDVAQRLPHITARERMFREILELAGFDGEDIFSTKQNSQLTHMVHVDWKFEAADTMVSRNVLGLIEGIDPELKNELVVIGAHYDHVGVSEAGVFNGANDNASGTSALLEAARVLALERRNKRSILIAFYSAEEKGLLGSKYLTESIAEMDDIVGKINMDMIGRGPTDSIYSIGSDKISQQFHRLVEEANQKSVQIYFDYKFNAPGDPERLYYRSDHYNFARFGIPVVFFFDYQMQDYHKVTDDVEKLNIHKIVNISELACSVARSIANLDRRLDVREGTKE